MTQKKILFVIIAFLIAAVAAGFFVTNRSSKMNQQRQSSTTDTTLRQLAQQYRHPLSGVSLEYEPHFFVISVLFDNMADVSVQPGLEHALVIYEALAEGGITRLLTLFDSTQRIERIGPIRSVRPYFIDWAREYGGILMHVGGSPDGLAKLTRDDELFGVDQIGAFEKYFVRDESLPAPHNVFSSFSSWLKLSERYAIPPASFSSWKFTDEVPLPETVKKQQIEIMYAPGTTIGWVYRVEGNQYLRFVNGERQYFQTGNQVTAANVILIEVESEAIDEIGRQRMETTGTGNAIVFTRGKRIDAQWIKESPASRMRFVARTQEEVALTPGVTWIQVIPSQEMVTYKSL